MLVALVALFALRPTAIYVSPRGLDSNPGSRQRPVASLPSAVDRARELGCHRISMERGTYILEHSLKLDARDAGLAINGNGALLTGSVAIPAGAIRQCLDPSILNRIIDPEARSKVVEVNLKTLGVDHLPPIEPRGFPHAPHPEFNELFHDDKPMRLARWPNEGYATVQSVVDAGNGEGDRDKIMHRPVFTIGDRAKLWAGDKDAWFYGYWKYDWADESIRAAYIASDGTITLANPHVYGVDKGTPVFAENLLEELDAPGEYWIDRENDKLYLIELTPGDATGYRISLLGEPLLDVEDSNAVSIDQLRFAVSRGDGIDIKGCKAVVVHDCQFGGLGERAATIEGGNFCGLQDCKIEGMGEGGVSLGGGDRQTLTHAHNFVENCDISDYERLSQTYRPAVLISGDGNRVSHCAMHDAPHSAIIFSGNDHVIEYNEFYRTVSRTGDGGVVYTGRDWTARGTVIRFNYFHDNVGLRKWEPAIYLDDLASGIKAYGNLIEHCHWAFLIGGGRDNDIENNVIVDCDLAFDCDARGLGWGKSMLPTLMERLHAVPYQSPPWSTSYPSLVSILDGNPLAPAGNVISRNLLIRSGEVRKQIAPEFAATAVLESNYATQTLRGDRFLRDPDDPVWRQIPGFEMLPWSSMGRR